MQSRRVLSAEVDNTLRDLHVSSYPPQSHSLIANYACVFLTNQKRGNILNE